MPCKNTPYNQVHVQAAAPGDAAAAERAVEALFAALPAAGKIGKGTHLVIKPNLLAPHAPHAAVTTHPHVLRAVILAAQRRGASHITVADSPGGLYTPKVMAAVYKTCGVQAVCNALGAKTYTACAFAPRANGAAKLVKQFNLIEPVLQADFIINLPKLKTHVMTGMSGAVKNLFGCVPGLQKAEFHMQHPEKERFGDMLVDLCETVQADMHIVDGLLAMEGDGPAGGTARACGVLFGAQNPYLLDLALCRHMGLAPMEIPFLAAAHRRGLCPALFDESLLVAETAAAAAPFKSFAPPRSYEGPLDFSHALPSFLHPLVAGFAKRLAPRPVIRRSACIGCGRCAGICPAGVIAMRANKAKISRQNCIRCFCCHEMCPVRAIQVRRSRLLRGFAGGAHG